MWPCIADCYIVSCNEIIILFQSEDGYSADSLSKLTFDMLPQQMQEKITVCMHVNSDYQLFINKLGVYYWSEQLTESTENE